MPARGKTKQLSGVGVLYARFSSHNQRDASIDQQFAVGRKKASELGIPIVEAYSDYAISGKTDKRPAFQRMMRDAEKGNFQYVIAWKSSRMGRNMLEALMNESKLNTFGVRVVYVEEDYDDTAAGRFALRSMMNVNQFYSESMAEDVVRGMNDNASKCMVNGKAGYGHKKGEDGKFVIDDAQCRILNEIYTRVSERESFVDIYNDLNRRGIPSPSGKEWNRSSFHRLMPPNERVIGYYVWGEHRIENGVPRLISDELYYKVSEVMKMDKGTRKRHRTTVDYLLTGKLYCGHCESPMIGVSGTGRSGNLHHYYSCRKKQTDHSCSKKNVRKEDIELMVAQAIRDYALRSDVLEWIADSVVAYAKKLEEGEKLSLLNDKLKATNKTIKNIMSAIEMGIFTDTTKDRLLELEREKAELTRQIKFEESNIISVSREDVIAGLSVFRDGDLSDPKYLAGLFDTFLIRVYLFDNELKLIFSFDGKNKTTTVSLKDLPSASSPSPECSYNLPIAPPMASCTNHAQIYMINGVFVITRLI